MKKGVGLTHHMPCLGAQCAPESLNMRLVSAYYVLSALISLCEGCLVTAYFGGLLCIPGMMMGAITSELCLSHHCMHGSAGSVAA